MTRGLRSGETPGFRDEVRAFLAENLPSSWQGIGALPRAERLTFTDQWRTITAERGLLTATWPREYGGLGLGKIDHLVVVEEFSRAGVPVGAPGDTISIKMFGNTVASWGTEEQKRRFLPRIVSGEDVWCQGYSEPDAGSDLASLRTRATLRDGTWHIDGQKTWTSNATEANWMFLLARTDPHSSRSRGLTMLVLPLDQPGVDVRPITMLTGEGGFCEVFLTDARTAEADVIGTVGDGWKVANSLLSHERGEEAAVNPVLFAHELDRLMEVARERGVAEDPLLKTRLARCFTDLLAMKSMGDRILDSYIRGGSLGPEASVSKLFWSEYHQRVTELALDILGPDALTWQGDRPVRWFRTDDPGAPNSSASWLTLYLKNSLSGTVYAGTSEIQRNIIAESTLGLPREPR